jgi:hypothetical protein
MRRIWMRRTLLSTAMVAGLHVLPVRSTRAGTAARVQGDRMVLVNPAPIAVRSIQDRYQLRAEIPARPWSRPDRRIGLVGGALTAPLVLSDGSVVIGTASSPRPTIVWVNPDGTIRATAPLDDRPSGELALGFDGRILVAGEGSRSVYVVAPDTTVRSVIPVMGRVHQGPAVLPDGNVLIVASGGSGPAELTVLDTHGGWISRRTLGYGFQLQGLIPDPLGCFWISSGSASECIDATGSRRQLPIGSVTARTTPIGDETVAMMVGTQLQIRSHQGAVRSAVEIGAAVTELWPLPGGMLALTRAGPPAELWLVTREGGIIARIAVGSGVEGVLTDPAGAFLIVAQNGEIHALEPDGSPRWTLSMNEGIGEPPVPLPQGGVALVMAMGGLFYVR